MSYITSRFARILSFASRSLVNMSLVVLASCSLSLAQDRLEFPAADGSDSAQHIVLIAGDEEYRSEETMPMLAKLLSQKHGFDCTVLFSFGPDGADYIDPNNQRGLRGLSALQDADLMLIGARFRTPDADQAEYITEFLNAGKPLIGIRTATHAFRGNGDFGGLPYDDFGLKILGETWVSHHGAHKSQGARATPTDEHSEHPILRGIDEIFCPSDVYGVTHLTDEDRVLMQAAVTESLDPESPSIDGPKNDPQQAFAWLHNYTSPDGQREGTSLCTTGGASVDFVDEDLRRLIVNAVYHLTGRDVPSNADVEFVDPFYPTFYGFINQPGYYAELNLRPDDFALGQTPSRADPAGSPQWSHRPRPGPQSTIRFEPRQGERIALVGGSVAERMNLFGYFETLLHTRFPDKQIVFRNFGWPADEVGNQQRPDNYTKIDNPMEEFGPEAFICFFGFNEHFSGGEEADLEAFIDDYAQWIDSKSDEYSKQGRPARFVLVSPIAFEAPDSEHLPDGQANNDVLARYTQAIEEFAKQRDYPFVDLFTPTRKAFAEDAGIQFTINGVHQNEQGDRLVANHLDQQLFAEPHPLGMDVSPFHRIREAVNDKSWYHLQDYRMLNGWYVYGGRRTWDTETFPREFQKIRKMVAVRDRYIWDMVAGKPVPDQPDDSNTGEVYIPETMFGTRDENFRRQREPETLEYPTPEESIEQMKVFEGMEVKLFASEREFPEFANPTQMTFDNQGRLWVSCMINYPQWLPGSAKPGDKLLLFEDTDGDGMADECKTFYDGLICPTGFEFFQDGVLVVDEPRILFLKDTDGDDQADEVIHLIDGIATDDTHHAMGAWEWSHDGYLHMLEGISMSTTLETPWGPFRNKGPSGAYLFDPYSWKFRHFKTPGYGNPWCLVFDRWGMGTIGDGTNAQQHWTSPLSGYEVASRRTLRPNFDNQGMRPAVGNDWLYSRHLPDDMQGQFTYACVINMHGMPRFEVDDEEGTAGFTGQRIDDLLDSTDKFFRPVDPQIGPDGAIWFGDWCNALIGHMQYSQRDPNRDHEHGRVYRLVNKEKPLIEPELQRAKSIEELLEQLTAYELRTRYRARRELRARDEGEVLAKVEQWVAPENEPSENQLCEAMWLQASLRQLDIGLVQRIMQAEDFHARAAAVNTLGNEVARVGEVDNAMRLFEQAINDDHPRVRLEAVRGLSFVRTAQAAELALQVVTQPLDYWIEYTLEHTLHALRPAADAAELQGEFLADADEQLRQYYEAYLLSTGPGGKAVKPLARAEDSDLSRQQRLNAMRQLADISGGEADQGQVAFERVCSACHKIGDTGKAFGPDLDDIGGRYAKVDIIKHIIWPNETIAKGYETVQVLTVDGQVFIGFILGEDDSVLRLGVASDDGKGREEVIPKEDIEIRRDMKASSMPEGLAKTISPGEFLDLIEYLSQQNKLVIQEDGWIETGLQDVGELRTHGDFVEISRDAHLQLGHNFPEHWSRYANLALSAADPSNREFAFHSPNEGTQSPAVAIRLSEPSKIRHITIQNRRNPQFYDRAEDLAVWISDDGDQWQRVWESGEPAAEYEIDLPAGTTGRYLKVGLDGKGILHLNQIVVYGEK